MNKFIKIILILLYIGKINICYSQTNKQVWTLDDCIDYAINNSQKIKQSKIYKDLATIEYNSSKFNILPDLYLNLDQSWSFGRGIQENNTYGNQSMANSTLGLSSSFTIFDGFIDKHTKKRNKLNLLASEQSIRKEVDNITILIMSQYLQILLNKEIYQLASQNKIYSEMQVENTRNLLEIGKVEETQLLEMNSQLAKDALNLLEADNSLKQSLFNFSQLIDIEFYQSFDIQHINYNDDIFDESRSLNSDQVFRNAMDKAVIKEMKYRLESNKQDIKIARAYYYPTIRLNLQYNNSYYHNYTLTEMQTNIPFREQLKNNGGEIIGISISVPIFDKNRARNEVKRANANYDLFLSQMKDVEKNLQKEIQEASFNLSLSKNKYLSSDTIVSSSKKVFDVMKNKYELGKVTVYAYNEAKNKYIQALSYKAQAKYEYIFKQQILKYYNGE